MALFSFFRSMEGEKLLFNYKH